ncbi:MAG: AmmeMemoRadiSam system protein B [Sedimentisphaerales bacterium]
MNRREFLEKALFAGSAVLAFGLSVAKAIVPRKFLRAKPCGRALAFIFCGTLLFAGGSYAKTVLDSPLGQMGWYPNDPNELRRQIEGFFQKADVKEVNDVIALINPHAGYAYSGQTAAMGIKSAKAKYSRIIVIGPTHQVAMPL